MDEMTPAEALSEVAQVQEQVHAEPLVPLWYFPYAVLALSVGNLGLDADGLTLKIVGVAISAVLTLAAVPLLYTRLRVRRGRLTLAPMAIAVVIGWIVLNQLVLKAAHRLYDPRLDWPWSTIVADLTVMLSVLLTTRPMERLVRWTTRRTLA